MFIRLIRLRDGGGDSGGIRNGTLARIVVRRGRGRKRPAEQLVEPPSVNFAAEKIWFKQDAAEKADVGFDAGNGVLVEGAAKSGDGFLAAIAPGDEFAEKRIVVVGNCPAVINAFVQPDSRTAENVTRKNFPRCGAEIDIGILGVES